MHALAVLNAVKQISKVVANFLFFVAIHGFFVCNGEEVPGGAGATTM